MSEVSLSGLCCLQFAVVLNSIWTEVLMSLHLLWRWGDVKLLPQTAGLVLLCIVSLLQGSDCTNWQVQDRVAACSTAFLSLRYSTWSWHRTLLRLSLQCFIQLFDRPVILYLLCCSLFERWDVLQFFSLLSSVICNSGCCWLNHVRLCAKCLLLLSRELNKRDKFFFWMNSAACLILYWNLLQFVQSCFLPKCSVLTLPALRVRLYLVLHLMTGVTNHVAQTGNKPSLLYCPNWNCYVK